MKEKYRPDIINRGWMSLDNAAKIYPPVINNELSSVFRIGSILSEPVKISPLQDAIKKTCKRFPYYLTTLRKGFFWYFLEFNKDILPPVLVEDSRPCIAFPAKRSHNALFRIIVYGNRLSIEFLHILTDGGGAMEFFRSLLVTYFINCKYKVPYSEGIIDPSSEINIEETEDAFNKYFRKDIPFPQTPENSWHLPFDAKSEYNITVSKAEIQLDGLKILAKQYKVTITEYLVSVYLYCLKEIHSASSSKKEKIIRVEVPVNMRKNFPSKTMRNFSLFIMPEIDTRLGDYTFAEIAKLVHNYMQLETDKKIISRIIARNVKPERNFFIRIMPLFIKDIVLSIAHKKHGASKYSGVLTNVGLIKMPEETEKHIKSFYIIPPPPAKELKVSCGVISYRNKMMMSFANTSSSMELERRIFSYLTSENVRVKIINNKFKDGK